jgi:hypothetical protein
MSVSSIASSSAAASYTPPVQQPQQAKTSQQSAAADTVTISEQAQQLVKDGDTQAQEISESGAERSSEALRGRA